MASLVWLLNLTGADLIDFSTYSLSAELVASPRRKYDDGLKG